ncbi:MAG TPA: FkbM family methyltransferase [Telluria sp.]|jgi:FkbM family methyltransferase
MSFITYAQNGEDILLWRVLGHLQNGFYIDVGANDPVEHSVTKAFYDAGWNGINVEPLPRFHQVFLAQRPRDINLAVAAGAETGELTLFDVPDVNGWASPDASVAAAHEAAGYALAELKVAQRTLNDICAQYVRGDVHFLKIDVEGFEGEVLRGIDLMRWRPWILVIEATMPNSRVTNHEKWESLVLACNYTFAYFDGLNRYYVAAEHQALAAPLALQPNVFDAFQSWQLVRAAEGARVQEQALQAANARLQEAEQAEAATNSERAAHEATRAALAGEYRAHQATRDALESEYAAHQATRVALEKAYGAQSAIQETLQAELSAHALTRKALEDEYKARSLAHDERQDEFEALLLEMRSDNRASEELEAHRHALAETGAYARKLEADLHETAAWAGSLERELLIYRNSRYLRLTARLRNVGEGRLHMAGPLMARRQLRRFVTWLVARESLRRLILPRLARWPWLAKRVTSTVAQIKSTPPPPPAHARVAHVPDHLLHLPASARRVFADLSQGQTSEDA